MANEDGYYTHRVVRGRFTRHHDDAEDEVFEREDPVAPDDDELEKFGAWFEELEQPVEATDTESFDAAGFVDRNTDEITGALRTGDFDDRLDAIADAEEAREGPTRSTVTEAVESRRDDAAADRAASDSNDALDALDRD
jgi:hypothetical protein